MNILIGCEFSGIVREAFKAKGHNTWSCDLLDTEIPGQHLKGDVLAFLSAKWDMMITFPDCKHLAVSGARWFKDKQIQQKESLNFINQLLNAPIPKIALENPIGVISTHIRKPDQIIQPWMFGHNETKATCLWLKNLPCLIPTNIVTGRYPRVHYESPSSNRWKNRSRTLVNVAQAMANQWG